MVRYDDNIIFFPEVTKYPTVLFNSTGELIRESVGGTALGLMQQVRSFTPPAGSRKTEYYWFAWNLQGRLESLVPHGDYSKSANRKVAIVVYDRSTHKRLFGVKTILCRSPEDDTLLLIGVNPPEVNNWLHQKLGAHVGKHIRIKVTALA